MRFRVKRGEPCGAWRLFVKERSLDKSKDVGAEKTLSLPMRASGGISISNMHPLKKVRSGSDPEVHPSWQHPDRDIII